MKLSIKVILSILIVWTFVNSCLFVVSFKFQDKPVFFGENNHIHPLIKYNQSDYFYPFTEHHVWWTSDMELGVHATKHSIINLDRYLGHYVYNFDFRYYDLTEFFIYTGSLWVLFFVYLILLSNFIPNQKSN